ncbi:MAG: FHA domain-containing protein [Anaerolinea sp.]|nr:FHA domain-containing protein [Anaerolinea sp.]MCC6976643.1 FHA domain-containing protein [Anaerolineae bacterium]CAG1012690.1 hypothetical protein ANRL4_04711 [Anaerolineae bacterium]
MPRDKNRTQFCTTFMSGPQDGKTQEWLVPANADQVELTIGRLEGCDIHIEYDTQVSRQHARVLYDARHDLFYVEDAGSRNGTYLEQTKITGRVPLKPGELFRVGRTWMRVDPDDNEVDSDPEGDDLPF